MKVFLSWAGEQSRHIADTLQSILPQIINALDPWMSPQIEKGEAWDAAIADGLNESPIGIICLTPDSLESKYVHYEAGAISNVKGAKVCTLLVNLKHTDVKQPLSRFQATKAEKDDFFQLLLTINRKVAEVGERAVADHNLKGIFERYWQDIEKALTSLPPVNSPKPERSERDMLEEILSILRKSNTQDITWYYPLSTRSLADSTLTKVHYAFFRDEVVKFLKENHLTYRGALSNMREIADELEPKFPTFKPLDKFLIDVISEYYDKNWILHPNSGDEDK